MFDSSESILDRIRSGDRRAVEEFYTRYYTDLVSFIRSNSGTEEEAKDIFQECMLVIYQYSRRDDRKPIDNMDAYFAGMYRNKWFLAIKKHKRDAEKIRDISHTVYDSSEEDVYYSAYLRALSKLGEDCQEILKYYVNGCSSVQLAELLSTTVDYAKRKKYLCKEKLKNLATSELAKYEI